MSKVIDNIEDIATIDSKAVLTTTQTALDLKANIDSPTFTGTVTAPTFSGNASTATNVAWSGVTSTPTTVAGYGITDIGSQSVAYASNSQKINPLSGDANYKLCYTADGQRTNAGEWGRAVMRYEPNGQTYGIRVDRADYADSAGNGTSTASFSENGYQRFNNGLIIQFGFVPATGTSGDISISFPIAFPSVCLNVTNGVYNTVDGAVYDLTLQSKSASGAQFNRHAGAGALGGYYIAIGY